MNHVSATTLRIDTRTLPVDQARQFLHLVEQANRGEESAMPNLVRMLDAVPALAQQLGDMTSITRGVGAADGGDQLAMAEAIRLESETLWAELAQSTDGPLERLLIDRLVTCPLHLEYAEAAYARQVHGQDVEWTDAYQRRIDRTQRRYLQSIRTLAQIRRLAVPAIQVNVAETRVNQVNSGIRTVA
jgi:hypothetical protein